MPLHTPETTIIEIDDSCFESQVEHNKEDRERLRSAVRRPHATFQGGNRSETNHLRIMQKSLVKPLSKHTRECDKTAGPTRRRTDSEVIQRLPRSAILRSAARDSMSDRHHLCAVKFVISSEPSTARVRSTAKVRCAAALFLLTCPRTA